MLAKLSSLSLVQALALLILAAFGINFAGLGLWILIGGCIALFLLKRDLVIPTTRQFLVVLLFAISYSACSVIFGGLTEQAEYLWVISIAIISAYLIGWNWQKIFPGATASSAIIFIGLSFATHGLLNYVYSLQLGVGDSGLCFDYWSKSHSASTAQGVIFTPFVSVVWIILLQHRSIVVKVATFIALLFAVRYNFMLGGRSFLLLLALAAFVYLVLKITFSADSVGDAITNLLVVFLLLFLILFLYQKNVFNLKSTFENSYMAHRFKYQSVAEDDRATRWVYYASHFSQGIFGGNKISISSGYGYAHNLWLDVFDQAGLIPFVLLLVLSFSSAIQGLRTAFSVNRYEGLYATSFYVIYFAQFFIEPILQGSPFFFISFVFITGLFNSLSQAHLIEWSVNE